MAKWPGEKLEARHEVELVHGRKFFCLSMLVSFPQDLLEDKYRMAKELRKTE